MAGGKEKREKKETATGEKGAPIYDDERGQGAGLRRICRGYVHRRDRYIDIRTYVRTSIYTYI